ncbi:MAG TPA: FG-GAP-like repeat-containing protein, partial [Cyclobacteriaceae bacterium]
MEKHYYHSTFHEAYQTYFKFYKRLQKSLKNGSFWRYSSKKRRMLFKRLKRYEQKLKRLRQKLGWHHFAIPAVSAMLMLATHGLSGKPRIDPKPKEVTRVMALGITNNTVDAYAAKGTLVGRLSGGTAPYRLTSTGDAQDDDNGLFTITGDSLLVNGPIANVAKSNLNVFITDDPGVQTQAFTINVQNLPSAGGLDFFDSGQTLDGAFDVKFGDMDNDGDFDAVILNNTDYIKILYNDAGDFTTTQTVVTTSDRPNDIVLSDMDGDGDLDIVTAPDAINSQYFVLLNDGGGSFSYGNPFGNIDTRIDYVELGDLDGDGDLDAVLEGRFIYFNDGSGNLANTAYSLSSFSRDAKLADLDDDGDLDVVLALYSADNRIYFNDGSGSFTLQQTFSSNNARSVQVGDLDNDGDLDIFFASLAGDEDTWLNDGTGYFNGGSNPFDAIYGNYFNNILGDVDGDGDLDAFDGRNDNDIHNLFLNNGSGLFSFSGLEVGDTYSVNDIALSDVDQDGDLDLFIASGSGSQLFLNDDLFDDVLLTNNTVDLFASLGTSVGKLDTLDSSNPSDTVIFSLIPGTGDDHNGYFTIDGDSLRVNADLSELNLNSLNIRVEASNGEGLVLEKAFNLSVFNFPSGGGFLNDSGQGFGDDALAAAIADMDGDGDLDIIQAETGLGTKFLRNDGTGNYFQEFFISGSYNISYPSEVELGDIDGDGDIDAVFATSGGSNDIWFNDGAGNLTHSTNFNGFNKIGLGDLDGDGDLDIFGNSFSNIYIYFNYGDGTFPGSPDQTIPSSGIADLGDLDGDGDLDAFEITNSGLVRTQRNTGGIFTTIYGFSIYGQFYDVQLGDLDSDGDLDALAVGDGKISIIENTGALNFTSGQEIVIDSVAQSVALGDMDGDGDLDAIIGVYNDYNLFLGNNGSGYFTTVHSFEEQYGTRDLAIGDLDNDGELDVFTVNAGLDSNSVFINDTYGNAAPTDIVLSASNIDAFASLGTLIGNIGVTDGDGGAGLTVRLVPGTGDDQNGFFSVRNNNELRVNSDLSKLNLPTMNIRLQANDGSGGVFEKSLALIVDGLPTASGGFFVNSGQSISAPSRVYSYDAVIGNIDADGDLEVITTNNGYYDNVVLENDGNGILSIAGYFGGAGNAGRGAALGDIDGDGDNDIVIAKSNENIWFNQGNGTFLAGQPLGFSYYDVDLGDIDGDGDLDAVFGESDKEVFFTNDGGGVFTSGQSSYYGNGKVELGDLDNDGDLDAFVLRPQYNDLFYVLENSAGTFSVLNTGPYGNKYEFLDVQLADIDLDGDLDAVAVSYAYSGGGDIQVLKNDGYANFSVSQKLNYTNQESIIAGDVDGDGDLDFITAGSGNQVYHFTNNGTGTFVLLQQFTSPSTFLTSLALGDLDNDGDLDLFITSYFQPDIVFRNDPASNDPTDIVLDNTTIDAFSFIGQQVATISVVDGDGPPIPTLQLVPGANDDHNGLFTIRDDSLRVNTDLSLLNLSTLNIRIAANDNAGGLFEKAFSISVNNLPTEGTANFSTANVGPTVYDTRSMRFGDIDGDGDLDAILGNGGSNGVFVFENDGYGNLTNTAQILPSTNANEIELGDLDGDGDLDIWLADGSASNIFTNDGSGVFSNTGGLTYDHDKVALGDLDNDGDLDAVIIDNNNYVIILQNDGGLFFSSSTIYRNYSYVEGDDITLGDIDLDGDLDILSINYGYIYINYNNGAAAFSSYYAKYPSAYAREVALGDLDNDGDLDIAIAGRYAFATYLNDSPGNFIGEDYNSGNFLSVVLGDIDGDGNLDALAGEYDPSNSVHVFINDGLGNDFTDTQTLAGDYVSDFDIGDIDSDGDLDVFIANISGQSNYLYFNNAVPIINNNAGLTINEADTLTITDGELEVLDADNDSTEIVFTITTPPSNGQLETPTNPGVALATFTQDSVDNNLVTYIHDGSETLSDAFVFEVTDGTDTLSALSFAITVNAVNDAPTFTTLSADVEATNEDTEVEITFAEIGAQSDTLDVDGTIALFEVQSVASGTLSIGTDAGSATPFSAGSNDVIDGSLNAYWTPDADANGSSIIAFDLLAQDDGGLQSSGAVNATVTVNAVNDDPVIDTNVGLTLNEGATAGISTAELSGSDVDNTGAELTYTVSSAPVNGQLELTSS